jgi:hypothetical protein
VETIVISLVGYKEVKTHEREYTKMSNVKTIIMCFFGVRESLRTMDLFLFFKQLIYVFILGFLEVCFGIWKLDELW